MNRIHQCIVIACALCISSIGCISENNSDEAIKLIQKNDDLDFFFDYSIDKRFKKTVTKENVEQARSVADLIPEKDSKTNIAYYNIQVSSIGEHSNTWIKASSKDELFNEQQIKLLNSIHNGASFSISGNVKKTDLETNEIKDDTLIYNITVMPFQPAIYQEGKDELIRYLQNNSEDAIAIARKDKIQSGMISFVISSEGEIHNVELIHTSGYESIDETMLKLIKDIPGNWQVAKNAIGNKVDQELTFFYGLMAC